MTDYEALVKEARADINGIVRSVGAPSRVLYSLVDAVEALVAENAKLREVATAAVRRLEKAARFCGDPQHPLWDGGRVSVEARRRIDGLIDILDPFRPELEEDVSDEDWDRVYKLDPIDAYVSGHEERMEERARVAEDERDALRKQLDGMHERDEVGVQVGGWPPTSYQDLDTARFMAAHPFAGREEYEHKVVTRRTLTGPWTVVEGDDQ